jgi:hypothetical protein
VGELFDEAPFFEFFEHLEEGPAVILPDSEGVGEVVEGDGTLPKLQKTQDVIWAEGGFGRHAEVPFRERGSGQN